LPASAQDGEEPEEVGETETTTRGAGNMCGEKITIIDSFVEKGVFRLDSRSIKLACRSVIEDALGSAHLRTGYEKQDWQVAIEVDNGKKWEECDAVRVLVHVTGSKE
jgi:hypothetical protein